MIIHPKTLHLLSLYCIKNTFNETENKHITSLHKNTIFIFLNLYMLVTSENNSNTNLSIRLFLIPQGTYFIVTTQAYNSLTWKSLYFFVNLFHDFIIGVVSEKLNKKLVYSLNVFFKNFS